MKKILVAIFILTSFVISATDDEINEIVIESLEDFEASEEIKDSSDSISSDSVKPTFTVSLFYPFFMGSAIDRFVSLATDSSISPNAVPFESKVNGGLDLHFHYAVLDYLIVSAGASWASYYNFIRNSSDKVESGMLFTSFNFRAGIGGIYPILNILQFIGGMDLGFWYIVSGNYLTSINQNYKDLGAPAFLMEPYIGLDVEVQKGLAISFRFDYALTVSGKKNSLVVDDPNNSIYFTHYPGIYLGLGFQF